MDLILVWFIRFTSLQVSFFLFKQHLRFNSISCIQIACLSFKTNEIGRKIRLKITSLQNVHAIAKVTWTISHLQPWYIYLRLPYLILLKYISIKIAICTQNKTLSFFSHRMSGYYFDRWNPCLRSNVWLALCNPLSMSKRQKEKMSAFY